MQQILEANVLNQSSSIRAIISASHARSLTHDTLSYAYHTFAEQIVGVN